MKYIDIFSLKNGISLEVLYRLLKYILNEYIKY